jgi:hypothetical protein
VPARTTMPRSSNRRPRNGDAPDNRQVGTVVEPEIARKEETSRTPTTKMAFGFPLGSWSFSELTAPAHLRRRASAQPVVNGAAEQPAKHAFCASPRVTHRLHWFATG